MRLVFPGSFNPPTLGHIDLIERAAKLGGELIVAVLYNPQKTYGVPAETRVKWLERCCSHLTNVRVTSHSGMLAELVKEVQADVILRGVRSVADYEEERSRAAANAAIGGTETLFLPARGEFQHICSNYVREILYFDGDISGFVPRLIEEDVRKIYQMGVK